MSIEPDLLEPELPLFPLRTVLFPDGLLALKVFEVRYLDMITGCLRDDRPFGVVALRSGGEVRAADESVHFEAVGTQAELIDTDSEHPGILQVRCRGTRRFRVDSSRQQADGLWLARMSPAADDEPYAPTEALAQTVHALANMIAALREQDEQKLPFLEPSRLDDAGWVANRWCEILPISQAARQRLMELPDPLVRLQLVDDFLRSKGVIS